MSLPAIFTVYGGKELRDFLKAPFLTDISRKPRPVAPRAYTKKTLDTARNPFFSHARTESYIARELLTPKGRITAFVDDAQNTLYGIKRGYFGLFEAVNDPDVARALMRPALGWLKDAGATEAIGPVGLTPLAPAGLPPDAPQYYASMLEEQGLGILSTGTFATLRTDAEINPPPAGYENHLADPKDPYTDLEELCSILEEQAAPGLSPSVTPQGIMYLWPYLRRIIGGGGLVLLQKDGVAFAAALVMPDPGPAVGSMRGSILPIGWLRFMLKAGKSGRALVLGPWVRGSATFSDALAALMPPIMKIAGNIRADEVVFHDPEGGNGPLMAELAKFSPRTSPGYVVYGKKLV